jgi:hypothetical protein
MLGRSPSTARTYARCFLKESKHFFISRPLFIFSKNDPVETICATFLTMAKIVHGCNFFHSFEWLDPDYRY